MTGRDPLSRSCARRSRRRPGPEWTTQRALALAVALGDGGARPRAGGTADLWEALATLAAADLGIARTVEPHLDALAILEQERGSAGDDGARGVDTHAGGAAARTWACSRPRAAAIR
ncbi:hypothetical protein BC477_17755 [Clavibacter michiganensis subsp. michiganensis]|uniref:Uncharacterized protein n=1 Tax=Clavibacter michiganensis subsp. michiganensis TaxID=33013 RepID=A0A251XDI4_CLAMM|nr:hypothetical protein BC477_17755 [Clavibacter michiganensis subsp. michiganensis]OUE00246.1 hypothetical protein CMMCAS07_17745 [Clavibacter michiganensis subsp. michiganensis]